MSQQPVILTDVPGKPGRFWNRNTTLVGPSGPPAWLRRWLGQRWASNMAGMVAALHLFARRGQCQGVVTSGGASGLFFAWLQRFFPRGRKPHVMVDCNWYEAPGRFRHWLKGLRLRLASPTVRRFVVWASHEIADYSGAFGLPPEKLLYVPFHTTLDDYDFAIRDEGYLFAGGNYDRDYATLIEAVRPLTHLPVRLTTTREEQLHGVSVPAHVQVTGTTAEGFRQAMAAARLVVVPMAPGLLHSGGQQTCLNAMFMGKPTIAVGRKWAVDFIEDGVHGLITDYGDAIGLRRAIEWVLAHPDQAAAMARRGQEVAARHTTEATMKAVYQLVLGASERAVNHDEQEQDIHDNLFGHPTRASAQRPADLAGAA